MSTVNHPNNIRLRELIVAAGITQSEALERFNRGQVRAISLSGFKAWLADPGSNRWRKLSENYLTHAEGIFSKDQAVACSGALVHLYLDFRTDRKSTRLNSSHIQKSRMPSSA